jgi:hypothetical protein
MKIFLSHRNRDKPLVNDFKELLPSFLSTWLDDDNLSWGDSLTTELRSIIQSAVDFLIIFLDKDSLTSEWVRQELDWAIERERELKRRFVLPILLPDADASELPTVISERLFLRLSDYGRTSIESLAKKAIEQLFKLVIESYACLQLESPRRKSLRDVQDGLSAAQAKLLGFVVQHCSARPEVAQREIEDAMGHSRTSAELFYRLETLIAQGFLAKRRIADDGMFSYRLTDEFRATIRDA